MASLFIMAAFIISEFKLSSSDPKKTLNTNMSPLSKYIKKILFKNLERDTLRREIKEINMKSEL